MHEYEQADNIPDSTKRTRFTCIGDRRGSTALLVMALILQYPYPEANGVIIPPRPQDLR